MLRTKDLCTHHLCDPKGNKAYPRLIVGFVWCAEWKHPNKTDLNIYIWLSGGYVGLHKPFHCISAGIHRQQPQFLKPVQWQQTSSIHTAIQQRSSSLLSLCWMPIQDNIPTWGWKRLGGGKKNKPIFIAVHKSFVSAVPPFLDPSLLGRSIKAMSICGGVSDSNCCWPTVHC